MDAAAKFELVWEPYRYDPREQPGLTMARLPSMLFFALGMAGGPLWLGCSTSSPSTTPPVCDGGVQTQGTFCAITESPENVIAGPGISLSRDIQPIFNHYCVVVGCHVSGNPVGALNLAPGFAYDQLVDAAPGETAELPDGDPLYYVVAGDLDHSYLHYKIHPDLFAWLKDAEAEAQLGTEMPAKATGSFFSQNPDAQAAIDDWIEAGALP
jgi:hypothetical protein